jgi:hypothetical protein
MREGRNLFGLILLVLFVSCDYIKQDEQRIPVARVNDSYLYFDEIEDLVFESATPEDSALIVSGFINRWATRQLLIDRSMVNLPQATMEEFEQLVQDYREELYTEAYKGVVVSQQLDSAISPFELRSYYESNKETFRLNETLLQMRYIHVDPSYSDLAETETRFVNFDSIDRSWLSEHSLEFRSFNFNDTVWVRQEAVHERLPILQGNSQVLKKSNYSQLRDSLGVYLVATRDVLQPGDLAPLEYIEPTLVQVILNQRKLELIKKLEKDITTDAIKNNRFEIYPRR